MEEIISGKDSKNSKNISILAYSFRIGEGGLVATPAASGRIYQRDCLTYGDWSV